MDSLSIKFDRKKLYDEIWANSLTGVSKKYGLNYTKLVQACKENNIPYPSPAYWTKKNMGLDFSNDIIELPESEQKEIQIPLKTSGTVINEKVNDKDKFVAEFDFLNFLEDKEKNKVVEVIYNLNINNFTRNHKVITEYKNKKKEERREERKANYLNPYYNIHNCTEKGYFEDISKFEKDRCMKILSTIYYAIEELGGKVNNDFSLIIREEHIKLEIEELKDQIKHELTKEEAKQLLEYEDRKKVFAYASKPNIRKYDYVHNGKLKITCGNRKYIRETDKIKLEDKLGDIIIKLYEQSEEVKIDRLAREERERLYQEEEERKAKIRNAKKDEAQKVKQLINLVEDYRIACEIRNYINAILNQNNLSDEMKDWIKWANKKADWFDPIIDREDEILGKREHQELLENKNSKLDRYGSYYDW